MAGGRARLPAAPARSRNTRSRCPPRFPRESRGRRTCRSTRPAGSALPTRARRPGRPAPASSGPELEVALADHVLALDVDQEGGPLAHHPVEAAQVPNVDAPALVPALAGRRPL